MDLAEGGQQRGHPGAQQFLAGAAGADDVLQVDDPQPELVGLVVHRPSVAVR